MGALLKTITDAVARLRDTTLSQRLALLLGGLLVAISLIWLVHWAARPEMVSLLEQDLEPAELAQLQIGLESLGEAYETRGNRVFVRAAANRSALLARLQQDERLPTNTSAGFDALVKQSDPWISMEESSRRWTLALQQALEQVLRQFTGVKQASVFLNLNTQKKSFTKQPPPSSAGVTLVMKSGEEVPHALALAAARLVSGAVAGLPLHNVQVVDGAGRVALDWDSERDQATQLDRRVAKEELRYAEKIRRILPDPKALLSVQVTLNSTARNTQTEQPLKGVPRTERTTQQDTKRGREAEQPGVQPNVGVAATGGATVESQQQRTTEIEAQVGVSRRTETTPPGDVERVSAAISLSHAYLVEVFRRTNPEAEPPKDAQVEEVFAREKTRLLAQVVQLVTPQDEENVAISWYYDAPAAPVDAPASPALGVALEFARQYGPQSILALVALGALGMMFRMARRSDATDTLGLELGLPKEAIEAAKAAAVDLAAAVQRSRQAPAVTRPAATEQRGSPAPVASTGEPARTGGESGLATPVEQAAVSAGMLVAQEVDAGTVQTRKMLEQIAQVVASHPEMVASLIEQWVQRGDQFHDEAQ